MYAAMIEAECGIIFVGERDYRVAQLSKALHELGLLRHSGDIVTTELIDALNVWRVSKRLPELEYIDPISLRELTGAEVGGDSLLLLARCAETFESEIERFDFCKNALINSRKMLKSLTEYLQGSFDISALPKASETSVKCAVVASLLH